VRKGSNNAEMTGHVLISGRSYGMITATRVDPWREEAVRRIRVLNLPRRFEALANHVEMKTVLMMIKSGATAAQIVINHASCGSEPGETGGCDAVLPELLPRGSTLTVLGTTAQGQPFHRTYEGRADE
jgi:hypothetical protein